MGLYLRFNLKTHGYNVSEFDVVVTVYKHEGKILLTCNIWKFDIERKTKLFRWLYALLL